jgi:hypothetical protein
MPDRQAIPLFLEIFCPDAGGKALSAQSPGAVSARRIQSRGGVIPINRIIANFLRDPCEIDMRERQISI